ncbi:hypothetical protein AB3S75_006185 [Citrus x aurantiifolia]
MSTSSRYQSSRELLIKQGGHTLLRRWSPTLLLFFFFSLAQLGHPEFEPETSPVKESVKKVTTYQSTNFKQIIKGFQALSTVKNLQSKQERHLI